MEQWSNADCKPVIGRNPSVLSHLTRDLSIFHGITLVLVVPRHDRSRLSGSEQKTTGISRENARRGVVASSCATRMQGDESSLVSREIRRHLRARKYSSINWGERKEMFDYTRATPKCYRITPGRPDYLRFNEATARIGRSTQESKLLCWIFTQILHECANYARKKNVHCKSRLKSGKQKWTTPRAKRSDRFTWIRKHIGKRPNISGERERERERVRDESSGVETLLIFIR